MMWAAPPRPENMGFHCISDTQQLRQAGHRPSPAINLHDTRGVASCLWPDLFDNSRPLISRRRLVFMY